MKKKSDTIIKKPAAEKKASKQLTEQEKVEAYLNALDHPLKAEINAVRKIIKETSQHIAERVKWNAPSYYYKEQDMVTFNCRAIQHVHLVFHHPAIVNIRSEMLEGDYAGRRMTYFTGMPEIRKKKKELEKVIRELMQFIDK